MSQITAGMKQQKYEARSVKLNVYEQKLGCCRKHWKTGFNLR